MNGCSIFQKMYGSTSPTSEPSYTRKTQEIAEMRKQLEAEREALLQQQEPTLNNPYLQEASKHITEEEHDLYSPEGMQAEIKKQAALMLKEMMQPAQQEIQAQAKNNAGSKSSRWRIQSLHKMSTVCLSPRCSKSDQSLKLEDAFYIVKAKVDAQKAKEEREVVARQRSQRRQVLTKTSSGANSSPNGTPKFTDAWEAYQYHKSQQIRR